MAVSAEAKSPPYGAQQRQPFYALLSHAHDLQRYLAAKVEANEGEMFRRVL